MPVCYMYGISSSPKNSHNTTLMLSQPGGGGVQRILYPSGNFYPTQMLHVWNLEYLPTFTIYHTFMLNLGNIFHSHGAYGPSFDSKLPTPTLKVKGTRPEGRMASMESKGTPARCHVSPARQEIHFRNLT